MDSMNPGIRKLVRDTHLDGEAYLKVATNTDQTFIVNTHEIKVEVINHLLWTSGGMHFDSFPLGRVVLDIERRFNLEITVTNEDLMEMPYTGTFQYAGLDEVMSVIAATMGIGYKRDRVSIEFRDDHKFNLFRAGTI